MRAVVLNEKCVEFHTDYEPTAVHDQMIAVRVLKAGLCETDLQLIRGYMGFSGVLGHEFVGVAEDGRYQGQRVCGEINCICGDCDVCGRGLGNHCPYRSVLGILNHDGAFADRLWLPEKNLHPIPDSVSNDHAVFVEPLAAAFQISAQLDLSRYSQAVILGDGRLGNLCAQVLHCAGLPLTVVGKHESKLELLEELGIKAVLLNDSLNERSADLVVDCTGSPSGLESALRLVRPRGTIVLKTTTAAETGPNLAPVVIDEVTIVGSRCGPFPEAIAALESKDIQVEPLVTGRFELPDINEALCAASAHDALKVLIDISE